MAGSNPRRQAAKSRLNWRANEIGAVVIGRGIHRAPKDHRRSAGSGKNRLPKPTRWLHATAEDCKTGSSTAGCRSKRSTKDGVVSDASRRATPEKLVSALKYSGSPVNVLSGSEISSVGNFRNTTVG